MITKQPAKTFLICKRRTQRSRHLLHVPQPQIEGTGRGGKGQGIGLRIAIGIGIGNGSRNDDEAWDKQIS